MMFSRRPRRAYRTAATVAASVLTVSLAAADAAPASAAPADRSDLPLQTQIIGGFWDGVRPLLDVQNPADDKTFYEVPEELGDTGVADLAPGPVLRERTFNYHVATLEVPVKVTQVLYVTTDALGANETNVTSIVHPPTKSDGNVISYQSFYDSANPLDNPSRMIAGNLSLGGLIPAFETSFLVPAPALGHPVVVADTQGKDANFAAGPAYGTATLDSLRAATAAETSPITPTDQIGLFGYSGGAIASNWAAIRAEEYAPEIEQRIVGVAQGGVLVDPRRTSPTPATVSSGPVWSDWR
ncbi:lipase family protein [Corynebacterium variabile]|uniref:lipase family protein n=1 Tax=Corynebacterium variabile TaxID=1727 RepID=UPI003FD10945